MRRTPPPSPGSNTVGEGVELSALIFFTNESEVLVATDTLATSTDGKPFKFTTKAFIVPHLKLLIAGTGIGGFLGRWFVHINDWMIVRGIDELDCHTPQILTAMWQAEEHASTTTIYHFGFSEKTGLIQSFAYKSTNDFRSDRLSYGLNVNPECPMPANCCLPRDIRKMMDDQRTMQDSLPKEERRLYIGGEIEVHRLSKDGFHAYTLDQFDDYARDEKAIYNNYS
jgi:hypothetical protein